MLNGETKSQSEATWAGRVMIQFAVVIIGGRALPQVECPSLESLERRHGETDESWTEAWLSEDEDPVQPE